MTAAPITVKKNNVLYMLNEFKFMQDTHKKHSAKFIYKLKHELCSKNVLLHFADKFPENLGY